MLILYIYIYTSCIILYRYLCVRVRLLVWLLLTCECLHSQKASSFACLMEHASAHEPFSSGGLQQNPLPRCAHSATFIPARRSFSSLSTSGTLGSRVPPYGRGFTVFQLGLDHSDLILSFQLWAGCLEKSSVLRTLAFVLACTGLALVPVPERKVLSDSMSHEPVGFRGYAPQYIQHSHSLLFG